jgi:uncharacterized membrane protein YuzA (DUF378 family)
MATSTAGNRTTTKDGLHPSQAIALAVGAAYTLVGIAGFFVTGFDDFAAHDTGEKLLGFQLNPLHNIVHLVIGVAGLALWRRVDTAKIYGWLLFIGYGATFVYGVLVDKDTDANFLALNSADDGLHLASALVGLVIALWPVRDRDRDRDSTGTTANR